MTKFNKGLFNKPKNKRISKAISIKSPKEFKQGIKILKKSGFTKEEKKALLLAQNRARAQLRRKNLSKKEKGEFKKIIKINLPKISRIKK